MKRSSRGVFDNATLRDIGDRIRIARGEKTQEEFAKRINVGRTVLANYEAGRRLPSSETLEAIAQAGNVTVAHLLTGVEATLDPFNIDTKYDNSAYEDGYAVALYIFEKMRASFGDKSDIERLKIWANVIPKLAQHLDNVIGYNAIENDKHADDEIKALISEFKEASKEDVLELIITLKAQSERS